MDMKVFERFSDVLAVFILLLLPLLLLLIAAIVNYSNALFYVLCIFWFGMGVIFYGAIYGE
jgi:hypothetical protein